MPVPVVVPDVRGYTPAFAKRSCRPRGSASRRSPRRPRGRVSEQQPPAGTQALSGTLVRLVLR
jgi:hypothetical protein